MATWPLKQQLYGWEEAHGISSYKGRNANSSPLNYGPCSPRGSREILTSMHVWLCIFLFALGCFVHCLDGD